MSGDNLLTALSVAKDCDIVTLGQKVIAISCDDALPPNIYYNLTSSKGKVPNNGNDNYNSNQPIYTKGKNLGTVESQFSNKASNNFRFALTGKVWAAIRNHYPELHPRICTRGKYLTKYFSKIIFS